MLLQLLFLSSVIVGQLAASSPRHALKNPNCLVSTPNGVVDMMSIPTTMLHLPQTYEGYRVFYNWNFALCHSTNLAPMGYQPCDTPGFVTEYDGGDSKSCEVTWDVVVREPYWDNSSNTVAFLFHSTKNGYDFQLFVGCGMGSNASLTPLSHSTVQVTGHPTVGLLFSLRLDSTAACGTTAPPSKTCLPCSAAQCAGVAKNCGPSVPSGNYTCTAGADVGQCARHSWTWPSNPAVCGACCDASQCL